MTQLSTAVITSVQKEDISHLHFPHGEVLVEKSVIEHRKTLLERAVVLGNTFKGKTRIIFEDSDGIKQIETHIWGLTDKRLILKNGIVIPIHRIHEVKL
ncbi:MAG: hypothetical protein HY841_07545 [Bacteroidetes bacterium]|nr:hypothetical protein [Bacteroidota bacterium]